MIQTYPVPDDAPDPGPLWAVATRVSLGCIRPAHVRPGVLEFASQLLFRLEIDPFPAPSISVLPDGLMILLFVGPGGRELSVAFHGEEDDPGVQVVRALLWLPWGQSVTARLAGHYVTYLRGLARQLYPIQDAPYRRSLEWMPEALG